MKSPAQLLSRPLAAALVAGLVLALNASAAAPETPKPEDAKKPAPARKAGDAKASSHEAPPVTNTPPIAVEFPKAVFRLAIEVGNDPFFPTSKRRIPKPPEIKPPPVIVPVAPIPPPMKVVVPTAPTPPNPPTLTPNPPPPATNQPPAVVVKPDLLGAANLSLRGISGIRNRRVAVIHTGAKSYDFVKGELMLMRLPSDQQLKVRCVDIRDRSAVFQVEGETETKELFLREGL